MGKTLNAFLLDQRKIEVMVKIKVKPCSPPFLRILVVKTCKKTAVFGDCVVSATITPLSMPPYADLAPIVLHSVGTCG